MTHGPADEAAADPEPSFRPPWWLRGPHAQTIVGSQWPTPLPPYRATLRTVATGDGDAVAVHDDRPDDWRPGGRVVVMVHGVANDHRSPLLVRLADKLEARGVRVFRWDMRGCGAGRPLARRPYHAGCSDDLARVVEAVLGWCTAEGPAPELSLFGVSLGGNVLLKYLGEDPARVPAAVRQAIAVNPPIDLVAGVEAIGSGSARIYDRHLTRQLLARLADWWRERPDAVRPAELRKPRGLREFDDWYTAPAVGFRDAIDYYERASAAPVIPAIRVPTTIVASRDDPLVPFSMFAAERVAYPACVRLVATDHGGHVGFWGRAEQDPDAHWLEWRIVEMVTAS